jgi:hypothetical protein
LANALVDVLMATLAVNGPVLGLIVLGKVEGAGEAVASDGVIAGLVKLIVGSPPNVEEPDVIATVAV